MAAVLTALFLILSSVVAVVFFYYKKKFRYWTDLGFVHTKPVFLFGDALGIGTHRAIGTVVNDVYNKFSKERFVGFWFLFRPSLLVRDPELIKTIFVKDFMTFHDRGTYVNETKDPLQAHLFHIAGTKWRNLRVKMTPTFTSGKMKMMYPIIAKCAQQLESAMEGFASKGEVIEVKEWSARYSTDVISLCAFGIDTNSIQQPHSDFRHYGYKLFEPNANNLVRGFLQFLVPDLADKINLTITDKGASKFFLGAIKDTMDYREKNKVRRNDFMDLLIQLKSNGKLEGVDGEAETKDTRKFTFEEAAAQAFVFFIAGFETSSTTIQFALYELAKNLEIQEKTRSEIKRILEKHNNELTYECAMDMEYLGWVIDETLRLYPPSPLLIRECNKNYQIPGTNLILPKGNQVIIDCIGLQNDPKYYPDPEKFDPLRFTEEEKAKRHHYSYLPFGEGPRSCIGMRFGLMQSKLGLISMLRNYKFSLVPETLMPMVFDAKSFVLQPKGGMHLKITKVSP